MLDRIVNEVMTGVVAVVKGADDTLTGNKIYSTVFAEKTTLSVPPSQKVLLCHLARRSIIVGFDRLSSASAASSCDLITLDTDLVSEIVP